MTDILLDRAKTLREADNFRLALHTYNNALREFERAPNNPKAAQAASGLQTRIEQVEEEYKQYLAKLEEEAKQEAPKPKVKGVHSKDFREVWQNQFADVG